MSGDARSGKLCHARYDTHLQGKVDIDTVDDVEIPRFDIRVELRFGCIDARSDEDLGGVQFDEEAIVHQMLQLLVIILRILFFLLGLNFSHRFAVDQFAVDTGMTGVDNQTK